MAAVTIRMNGLEGRLQWRQHKLFKLRAKLFTSQKDEFCQMITYLLRHSGAPLAKPLFAF
jgi:hypothetical protein